MLPAVQPTVKLTMCESLKTPLNLKTNNLFCQQEIDNTEVKKYFGLKATSCILLWIFFLVVELDQTGVGISNYWFPLDTDKEVDPTISTSAEKLICYLTRWWASIKRRQIFKADLQNYFLD